MPAPQPPAIQAAASPATAAASVAATVASVTAVPPALSPARSAAGSLPTAISRPPAPPPAAAASAEPFALGVPAGDAYAPTSLAIDAVRGRAYVYHADSAENRPAVSVVDLASGQVTRLIRLGDARPSGDGRIFLSPDGAQAYVIDYNAETLIPVDTGTGALGPPIPGIRDGVLSPNGVMLYALGSPGLRAYNLAALLKGEAAPVWEAAAARFERLALNGDRLLASRLDPERQLLVFDAATGRELATTALADYPEGLAPGPDGGWAARVTGDSPRVLRFDRDLKLLASAPAPYGTEIFYDAARGRYIVAGQMPGEEGRTAVRALRAERADDLAEVAVLPWPAGDAPDVFAPFGDGLVGLKRSGAARLYFLGPGLDVRTRIVTGVTLADMALDEAADTLYVADDQGQVHVLALPAGQERAAWPGAAPLALDAVNRRLYVNSAAGVQALDLSSGQAVATFPQRGVPAPDPAGDHVYIADRGVTIYHRAGRTLDTLPGSFPQELGGSPNPYAYAARVNPATGAIAVAFNNGVPGSNNGSYLRIYPAATEAPLDVPGAFSFLVDTIFDPATGELFASYGPTKNLEALQRLGRDGRELARLGGRTGRLALDTNAGLLYVVQEGAIARVRPDTLALVDVWQGPARAAQVALHPRLRQLYVLNTARSHLTVVSPDALQPVDMRPRPVGALPATLQVDGLAIVGDGGGQWAFVEAGGALYRSRDGQRWEQLPVGSVPTWGKLTAAGDGTLFYAGIGNAGSDGVWRSTDFGTSWALASDGLTDLRTSQPVRAESAGKAYFVGATGGLFAWQPAAGGGLGRWTLRVAAKSEWEGVGQLSLAPGGALFLEGLDLLRRSTDGGQHWLGLRPPAGGGALLGFSDTYTGTQTLFGQYGAAERCLFRSTDGGETWARADPGINLDPSSFSLSLAAGDGVIYLHARGYGDLPSALARSTDDGESWQVADAHTLDRTLALAVAPDGKLWFGLRGEVLTLDPGAIPWIAISFEAQPAQSFCVYGDGCQVQRRPIAIAGGTP